MQESMEGAAAPPPRRRRRWVRWVLLAALVLLAAFVTLIVYVATAPYPAADLNRSIGTRSGVTNRVQSGEASWYASVDESIQAEATYEGVPFVSEPLMEVERDGIVSRLYFIESDGDNHELGFSVLRFEEEEGLYSAPLHTAGFYGMNPGRDPGEKYFYEMEEEWVADSLVTGLSLGGRYSFSYAGASADPAVRGLTVLGMPPAGVVEYEYEGTTYYFWYYGEDADFYGYLEEDPDFDFGGFTIGQLVVELQIEVPE